MSSSGKDCQGCGALRRIIEIRTPTELEVVIAMARAAINAGELQAMPYRNPLAEDFPFGSAEGWPDLVDWRFACTTCGQGFALVCETYHGAGGSWRLL